MVVAVGFRPTHWGDRVSYSGIWVVKAGNPWRSGHWLWRWFYPRYAKAGNTPVLVNGQRVPMIGRVSMDMITVDQATQPHALPGDPVTLWGDGLAVEEIALCAETILYTLVWLALPSGFKLFGTSLCCKKADKKTVGRKALSATAT